MYETMNQDLTLNRDKGIQKKKLVMLSNSYIKIQRYCY